MNFLSAYGNVFYLYSCITKQLKNTRYTFNYLIFIRIYIEM